MGVPSMAEALSPANLEHQRHQLQQVQSSKQMCEQFLKDKHQY